MNTSSATPSATPNFTPLFKWHQRNGGRLVVFSNWSLPVQYSQGVKAEHHWVRTEAGLFDVSHMGQIELLGESHEHLAAAVEEIVPADILNLKPGKMRYSQILNDQGGIVDDLIITRLKTSSDKGRLFLVINAARVEVDMPILKALAEKHNLGMVSLKSQALVALQGPRAAAVLGRFIPGTTELEFMTAGEFKYKNIPVLVTRSGYTGEDGFEISISTQCVNELAEELINHPSVLPCGLGARDTLRLEAGLCLYGNDLDETTSLIEAGLLWSIQKRRRESGGFPGFERFKKELSEGPKRKRVGMTPQTRAPIREGAKVLDRTEGNIIGEVTSGGFGPSCDGPISMGYIAASFAQPGTKVVLEQRGKEFEALVTPLPFVPHRYHK